MSVQPVTIAAVVEGHGEVPALPKVLYRIAHHSSVWNLRVPTPFRVPRGRLLREGGIENVVAAQAHRVGSTGGVLMVLDADDDCPADLGPRLLARARSVRSDIRVSVVLSKSEFEAWFIAAATSLGGRCGLPSGLEPPANPEGIRDAKGWIATRREDGLGYQPTVDQPMLASAFDLDQARKGAPSFDKFWREVESLLDVT